MNKTKQLGDEAERLACEYLVKKGFKIMETKCALPCGEIDIIAKKRNFLFFDRTIHFIEVKSLNKSPYFFPEQKVNFKKREKYKKLIKFWFHLNKYPLDYPCQVDIIAISFDKKEPEIRYFEDVVKEA